MSLTHIYGNVYTAIAKKKSVLKCKNIGQCDNNMMSKLFRLRGCYPTLQQMRKNPGAGYRCPAVYSEHVFYRSEQDRRLHDSPSTWVEGFYTYNIEPRIEPENPIDSASELEKDWPAFCDRLNNNILIIGNKTHALYLETINYVLEELNEIDNESDMLEMINPATIIYADHIEGRGDNNTRFLTSALYIIDKIDSDHGTVVYCSADGKLINGAVFKRDDNGRLYDTTACTDQSDDYIENCRKFYAHIIAFQRIEESIRAFGQRMNHGDFHTVGIDRFRNCTFLPITFCY